MLWIQSDLSFLAVPSVTQRTQANHEFITASLLTVISLLGWTLLLHRNLTGESCQNDYTTTIYKGTGKELLLWCWLLSGENWLSTTSRSFGVCPWQWQVCSVHRIYKNDCFWWSSEMVLSAIPALSIIHEVLSIPAIWIHANPSSLSFSIQRFHIAVLQGTGFFISLDTNSQPQLEERMVRILAKTTEYSGVHSDKDLWLHGTSAVEVVIILTWSKISNQRVKGFAEVWSRVQAVITLVKNPSS